MNVQDQESSMQDETAVEVNNNKSKKPGRKVSALIVATRNYEHAHDMAEKARAALDKVQPLVDNLAEAETEEKAAWEELQVELKNAGLVG